MALISDGVADSVNSAIEILPGQTVDIPITAAEAGSDDVSDADYYRLELEASKTYTLILSPDTDTVSNAIALQTAPGILDSLNQITAPGVFVYSGPAHRNSAFHGWYDRIFIVTGDAPASLYGLTTSFGAAFQHFGGASSGGYQLTLLEGVQETYVPPSDDCAEGPASTCEITAGPDASGVALENAFEGTIHETPPGQPADADSIWVTLRAGFEYDLFAAGVGDTPLEDFTVTVDYYLDGAFRDTGIFDLGSRDVPMPDGSVLPLWHGWKALNEQAVDRIGAAPGQDIDALITVTGPTAGDYLVTVGHADDIGDNRFTPNSLTKGIVTAGRIDPTLPETLSTTFSKIDTDWFKLVGGVTKDRFYYVWNDNSTEDGAADVRVNLHGPVGLERIGSANRSAYVWTADYTGRAWVEVEGNPARIGTYDVLVAEAESIVEGTDEGDALTGTDADEFFFLGHGNDTVATGAGDDMVDAGKGRDTVRADGGDDLVRGGFSRDVLYGGKGRDTILGDDGNDALRGQSGADALYGGSGKDNIKGHTGNDILDGGAHDDTLFGGAHDDVLDGGTGTNRLFGGTGDDLFLIDLRHADTRDVIDGGAGIDTVRLIVAEQMLEDGTIRTAIQRLKRDVEAASAGGTQETSADDVLTLLGDRAVMRGVERVDIMLGDTLLSADDLAAYAPFGFTIVGGSDTDPDGDRFLGTRLQTPVGDVNDDGLEDFVLSGGRATHDTSSHLLVLGDPAREGLLPVGDTGEDLPAGVYYLARSGDIASDNNLNWGLRFEDPQVFVAQHVSQNAIGDTTLAYSSAEVLDYFTPPDEGPQPGPVESRWPSIAFAQRTGTLVANRANDITGLVQVSDLNGDGVLDWLLTAEWSYEGTVYNTGSAYVSGAALSRAPDENGVLTLGVDDYVEPYDTELGKRELHGTTDFDGDGFGDLLVAGSNFSGTTYTGERIALIKGHAEFFLGEARLDYDTTDHFTLLGAYLETLAATGFGNGFTQLNGGPWLYNALADINGDGRPDLVMRTDALDANRRVVDHTNLYVLFGEDTLAGDHTIPALIASDQLVSIKVAADAPSLGEMVYLAFAIAGDVNGDGYDDLFIRKQFHYDHLSDGGDEDFAFQLVFGGDKAHLSGIDLSDMAAGDGYVFRATGDTIAATNPHAIGDVNGDGADDILLPGFLSVPGEGPDAPDRSGTTVLYGGTVALARMDAADGLVDGVIDLSLLAY